MRSTMIIISWLGVNIKLDRFGQSARPNRGYHQLLAWIHTWALSRPEPSRWTICPLRKDGPVTQSRRLQRFIRKVKKRSKYFSRSWRQTSNRRFKDDWRTSTPVVESKVTRFAAANQVDPTHLTKLLNYRPLTQTRLKRYSELILEKPEPSSTGEIPLKSNRGEQDLAQGTANPSSRKGRTLVEVIEFDKKPKKIRTEVDAFVEVDRTNHRSRNEAEKSPLIADSRLSHSLSPRMVQQLWPLSQVKTKRKGRPVLCSQNPRSVSVRLNHRKKSGKESFSTIGRASSNRYKEN